MRHDHEMPGGGIMRHSQWEGVWVRDYKVGGVEDWSEGSLVVTLASKRERGGLLHK